MSEKNYLPTRILHDFAERMERIGVDYMLSGSMAMMHYSVYRFTADVDVVVEINAKNLERIFAVLEPDYYIPHQSARRAVSDEKMFNVIHIETAFKIDCVVKKKTEFQLNAFDRRRRVDFFGREISIITQEDLIISKLWWAKDSLSEKQLTDVRNLLKNETDVKYLEKWAKKLNVFDLLVQCSAKESDE